MRLSFIDVMYFVLIEIFSSITNKDLWFVVFWLIFIFITGIVCDFLEPSMPFTSKMEQVFIMIYWSQEIIQVKTIAGVYNSWATACQGN
jgi:hypothetical protein